MKTKISIVLGITLVIALNLYGQAQPGSGAGNVLPGHDNPNFGGVNSPLSGAVQYDIPGSSNSETESTPTLGGLINVELPPSAIIDSINSNIKNLKVETTKMLETIASPSKSTINEGFIKRCENLKKILDNMDENLGALQKYPDEYYKYRNKVLKDFKQFRVAFIMFIPVVSDLKLKTTNDAVKSQLVDDAIDLMNESVYSYINIWDLFMQDQK